MKLGAECTDHFIKTKIIYIAFSHFVKRYITQKRFSTSCTESLLYRIIECVPLAGSPGKCWFTKGKKSAIHLHVIPVMKYCCVFWEFAKRKLATRKEKIR
jgi:hypothetical protein